MGALPSTASNAQPAKPTPKNRLISWSHRSRFIPDALVAQILMASTYPL